MRARCESAEVLSLAQLPDHRLEFPRWSEKLKSGVASVVPSSGDIVFGVIWSLAASELPKLDAAEGLNLPVPAYRREMRSFEVENGSTEAWVYLCTEAGREYPLSEEYRQMLVRGAEQNGLPAEYIAMLQALPVTGEISSAP